MTLQNSAQYDAVIIGAGIGGLVCGCYLAKAGMKVLIAEQHYKPGGYCTSFTRKGFTFDAAAHSIGGYKYGLVGKIFKDLEIEKKVEFFKIDPSDTIIAPDYKLSFWADTGRTMKEFQRAFPEEKENLKLFFSILSNADAKFFLQIRKWTFKNLLDKYFTNEKLKTILSFPLFGNGGLPPTFMSAFVGIKIYQEFLLDGGYYPKGGMQILSNALAARFKEFGGELRLSCAVKKIRTKGDEVTGVVFDNDGFIPSKYIISNCDAIQTFFKLLGKGIVKQDFLRTLKQMVPTLSGFILYLGVEEGFKGLPEAGVNMWYLLHYNLEDAYLSVKKGDFKNMGGYVIHVSPDKKTVFIFINAPFRNQKYWRENKMKLLDYFIHKIELNAIPELSKHTIFKEAATPSTLFRYTLNYKGAAFGWASLPTQLAEPDFKKPSFIKKLYLTGHWTTHGLGIPGVAYLGFDTAHLILKQEKLWHKAKQL